MGLILLLVCLGILGLAIGAVCWYRSDRYGRGDVKDGVILILGVYVFLAAIIPYGVGDIRATSINNYATMVEDGMVSGAFVLEGGELYFEMPEVYDETIYKYINKLMDYNDYIAYTESKQKNSWDGSFYPDLPDSLVKINIVH